MNRSTGGDRPSTGAGEILLESGISCSRDQAVERWTSQTKLKKNDKGDSVQVYEGEEPFA